MILHANPSSAALGLIVAWGYLCMIASAGLVGACGHAPGTMPEDMGATQHQAAAEHEDGVAAAIESSSVDAGCVPSAAVCWTGIANPSAEQIRRAEHHRALAAEHRAASQALRDAEAAACAGISAADRETSPFEHTQDIRYVAPSVERHASGQMTVTRTVGARVTFRAVPGMTAEWLQRLVDCHLARNAALGYETAMKEMPSCPLAVAGARAEVESVGDGFEVSIGAADEAAAKEILRRGQTLR